MQFFGFFSYSILFSFLKSVPATWNLLFFLFLIFTEFYSLHFYFFFHTVSSTLLKSPREGRSFGQHSFREPLFLTKFSPSMEYCSLQLLHDLVEEEICKRKHSKHPTTNHTTEILLFSCRFSSPISQNLLNSVAGTHLGTTSVT